MDISISELAINSPEPFTIPSSDSWQHLHFDLGGSTPVVGLSPQNSWPASPAMSSPIVLDTFEETLRNPSAGSRSDYTSDNPIENADTTAIRAQEHTAELGQQSNSRKRKPVTTRRCVKRNNDSQAEHTPRGESELRQVENFIEMEKEKCARLGITYDEHNYLSPTVAEWITALDKEDERAAVSMISTGIGSSESIALLQRIVVKSRTRYQQAKPAEDLALADRVREIQILGSQRAFIQFLRRCHIWKLYSDISREVPAQESGFVVLTPESMSTRKGGRAGNPRNHRDSEITKAMICGSASELDHGSGEHRKQYRYYSALRRLGQRLKLLTDTFGFGVLGLIPSQDLLETADPGVRISDETWVLFVCIVMHH
jgi:hypothetical protein